MKRLMTTTTALVTLTAGAAIAATDISAVDLDGNGFASIEEIRAIYPDLSVSFFRDMDTNGDNRVSSEEILTTEAQNILGRLETSPMDRPGPVVVLDADSDGFISIEDMRRGYPEFTELDFDTIDENDDNRVTYEEIYATEAQDVVARYQTGTVMDIAEIDADGDEFADFDEMVTAFPGLDRESFDNIDLNGDNRISANELYEPDAQIIVSRYAS